MCGRLGLPTLQVQKDEFMSNNWVLALLWCSSASGEESPLWKGCFVMYHVEILMGLERGMSWSTSGPVRRSFPNERWKGMVSNKGQSVSDIFAQQNLFVVSFFSSS